MRRLLLLTAVLAAFGAVMAASASADYGKAAVHQVEISASIQPNLFGPGTGGGIWLWIELSGSSATSGGTGDYTGSDCLHHTPIGPTGAVPDSGDVTWTSDGSTITIYGVVIGGGTPVTITVPLSGHERISGDISTLFSGLPHVPGSAQVQVAP
jgi:beta-glucanase (GH16 family)